MKRNSSQERVESPRFIKQQETKDTLAMAQESLKALNEDYYQLDLDTNPRSKRYPYEGAVLFGIDGRLKDRASTLAHSPADKLEPSRLDFNREFIQNRRIILSQSALYNSLESWRKNPKKEQAYYGSKMNDQHLVWAQPLIHEDSEVVGAVQLAFTVNQPNENWTVPTQDDLTDVWEKHQKPMGEVARALASLATKTTSLSKSLEIMPPITPNAFVIGWDVVKSTGDALSDTYATQEAYLERWKLERQEIIDKINAKARKSDDHRFEAKVLDRGDGEFIILPIQTSDVNDRVQVRLDSQNHIPAIVDELIKRHAAIAQAYVPTIFKKIQTVVGAGNFEEDQDGNLTSQAIYEIKNSAEKSTELLIYSPSAKKILF